MKIVVRCRVAALAAALSLLAVTGASAQSTAPEANATAVQTPRERVEAYIEKLRSELKITPAESAAWHRYTAIMRENAREMGRAFERRAAQLRSMNAVESLKSYERLAAEHLRRLRKLIPAFEKLYREMPAEQKKIADRVFRANAERHIEAHTGGNQQRR